MNNEQLIHLMGLILTTQEILLKIQIQKLPTNDSNEIIFRDYNTFLGLKDEYVDKYISK